MSAANTNAMFNLLSQTLRQSAALGMLPTCLATVPLTPEMRLVDLGIDSLGSMTLLSEVGERLSLPLPDLEVSPTSTLGDISRLMQSAREQATAPPVPGAPGNV